MQSNLSTGCGSGDLNKISKKNVIHSLTKFFGTASTEKLAAKFAGRILPVVVFGRAPGWELECRRTRHLRDDFNSHHGDVRRSDKLLAEWYSVERRRGPTIEHYVANLFSKRSRLIRGSQTLWGQAVLDSDSGP